MQNCVNCLSFWGVLKVNGGKACGLMDMECMRHFCKPYKYVQDFNLVCVKSEEQEFVCVVSILWSVHPGVWRHS